jgi:hypothetical protein
MTKFAYMIVEEESGLFGQLEQSPKFVVLTEEEAETMCNADDNLSMYYLKLPIVGR